jgi:NAD(P)H-dependent FMN reductase
MRVAVINAGVGGSTGNSARLCEHASRGLAGVDSEVVVLAERSGFEANRALIERADALVFATGTYWDAWSSHLSRFLEEATPTEGSDVWLGKPVAVLLSCHEVGAKGVLSRLQGVLSCFGCLVPPMSGVVISFASQLAREHASEDETSDLWRPDDVDVAMHNLLEAARGTRNWRAWEVDRVGYARRWLR